MFQAVLRPDVATNKVAFKLLGLLPGYVGLRGQLEPVGGGGDTVKVFFDRPVLSFGGALTLRIGARAAREERGQPPVPPRAGARQKSARAAPERAPAPVLAPRRPPPRRPAVVGAAGDDIPRRARAPGQGQPRVALRL